MKGAVILGASSPVARAIVRALSRDGFAVGGISLHDWTDDALVAQIVADCTDPEQVRASIDALALRLGGLSVLVTAAAYMPIARVDETTPDEWMNALNVTLSSAFYAISFAAPHMSQEGGAIVAISSVNAARPTPGIAAYAAAKGGLEALVREAALDLGGQGIRVNAVAPGLIGAHGFTAEREGYALDRVIEPEDVAEAVSFLASDRARVITGIVLPVDGGLNVGSSSSYLRPDLRRRLVPRSQS